VTAYDQLVDGSTGKKKYHGVRGTGTSHGRLRFFFATTLSLTALLAPTFAPQLAATFAPQLAATFAPQLAATFAPSVARALPRVHVHGASSIDVRIARDQGKLGFRGTLKDDTGRALVREKVRVNVTEGGDGTNVAVERCQGPATSDPHNAPGSITVETNDDGNFCVAVSPAQGHYVAHFVWEGAPDLAGSDVVVNVDPSRRGLELRFDPEDPKVIDLDKPSFDVGVVALTEEGAPESLLLRLTDERNVDLGEAATTRAGKTHFVVPRDKLGLPGAGELRVRFDGDGVTSAATRVASIYRRATVAIRVEGARDGVDLPAADPEDGVAIAVTATTEAGALVTTGVVEATVDGRAVGSAPVEKGRAELVATFTPSSPSSRADPARVDIELRYASDAPWFVPGSEAMVRLPLPGKNPVRRGLILVASLGVVLWLALARRRPSSKAEPKPEKPVPTGDPRISVLRRANKDAPLGWTGRVVDAHEGVAVAGADVRVERPSFTGVEILARTSTDANGRFDLRCAAARKGDRLVAAGPLHRTVERPLPIHGEVEIAVVRRKRAILDRLLTWAKGAGGLHRGPGDPTPALVARAARDARDEKAGQWARAVEGATFGPDPVDEAAEEEVEKMGPHRR
jgi:hypothetical protein